MKNIDKTFRKLCALAFMMGGGLLHAATFTAVSSGDWTSSATWSGGNGPGTTIDANDDIIINTGVVVNLDQDVTLNGFSILVPGGSITVDGTLQSTNNSTLYMNNGDLSGNGTLDLSRLEFSGLSSFGFSGMSSIETFATSNLSLTLSSAMDVQDTLRLNDGTLTLNSGAALDLQTNSTVVVDQGSMTTGGGVFSSAGTYNVMYVGTSKNTGIEINGSGMNEVYIDLDDNTQELSLSSDLMVSSTLHHNSGILNLNGSDIMISGDYMANNGATISGSTFSSVTVTSSSNLSSSLEFTSSANEVDNLTVNFSNGSGKLTVDSDVMINGALELENGDLEIDGASSLMMNSGSSIMIDNGSIILANGTFDGSASYDVVYNGGSKTSGIELSGSGMNDLTIDLDSNSDMVSLNSNFSSTGDINMQSGGLDFSGYDLEIAGDYMASMNGWLAADANSNLTLSSANSLSDTIMFSQSGNTMNSLVVDIDNDGTAMIGTNMSTNNLDFNSGSVVIFDNNLKIVNGGSITGANEDSYVMIEGEGTLDMDISGSSAGYVEFPVGTATSYSPAQIESMNASSATFMVNVANDLLLMGDFGADLSATESVVDRTWNIYSSTGSTTNMNLKLNWSSDMEVNGFDRNNAYISHFVNAYWDVTTASSASTNANGMYEISRNNITSLSPFSVVDENSAVGTEEEIRLITEIYPNPTQDILFLTLENQADVNIDILDQSGKIVFNVNSVNNARQTIDLSAFESGVYFVRVANAEHVSVERLVKL